MKRLVLGLAVGILLSACPSWSEPPASPREEDLRVAREEKAARLQPKHIGKVERFFTWLREGRVPEQLATPGGGFKGLRPVVRSIGGNSGLALGVVFDRPGSERNPFGAHWSFTESLRQYHRFEVAAGLEKAMGGRLRLVVEGSADHMPQEVFFGSGPSSSEGDETRYRIDSLRAGLSARLRVAGPFALGARGGVADFDLGSGKGGRQVLEVFPAGEAPGLLDPPSYLSGEVFAEVDWRDVPANPRRGGLYAVSVSAWDDRSGSRYEFRRLTGEVRQYFPFALRHHALVVRARAVLDDVSAGRDVPFYLAATLGGPRDLRGYRKFRFRDRNQLLFSAEYVWDAGAFFDAAIFADAGKVARHRRDLDLRDLRTDYGMSFRVKGLNGVALRLDVAHGDEGLRAFVVAGGTF